MKRAKKKTQRKLRIEAKNSSDADDVDDGGLSLKFVFKPKNALELKNKIAKHSLKVFVTLTISVI